MCTYKASIFVETINSFEPCRYLSHHELGDAALPFAPAIFPLAWIGVNRSLIPSPLPLHTFKTQDMRNLGLPTLSAQKLPWICPECLQRQQFVGRSIRPSSTRSRWAHPLKPRRRLVLLTCATTGVLGAGALVAASDQLKHGYSAAERTSRVAKTLFACINE